MEDWSIENWNADYYSIVEEYFWAPSMLGRRPMQDVRPLEIFRRLRSNEVPLNHVLMIFFRLAPSDFTRQLFETWFSWRVTEDFELLNSYQVNRMLVSGFTQPDLFFAHPAVSFMVEMKIDAKSSEDQVLKYVALSHLESKQSGVTKPMYLAYLVKGTPETTFKWRPGSPADVVDRVNQMDRSEYRKKWGFLEDEDWSAIENRLRRMELRFATYRDFGELLAQYEAGLDHESPYVDTIERLFRGARMELESRGLA